MLRFSRFSYTLFPATRITLFRHTPPLWVNPVNPRHEQIEALLLQANALVKNYDYIGAAVLYDQIRVLPEFAPENHLSHLHDLFWTYAYSDHEKLRQLFLSDRNKDYFRNYISETGNTALHIALRNGLNDVAESIATAENIFIRNDSGFTPIHIAISTGNHDFTDFIIKKFGSKIKKMPQDEAIENIFRHEPYPDGWMREVTMTFFEIEFYAKPTDNPNPGK